MKQHFLAIIALGIFSTAQADSSRLCSQSNSKFLEVARDYSACNSITGADHGACNRFCDESDKLIRGGYSAPSQGCSVDQMRQIQNDARQEGISQGIQQGRNEVLRDLSVREDYVSQSFYGINEADCAARASMSSQRLRIEAINRCNQKAASIRNCYIQNESVSGTFGRPPKFEGTANFKKDDNRSTQDECQKTALSQATTEALRSCNTATGSQCTIRNQDTILTHRVQAPSGPRMGRRDDRICDARVFAEAPQDLTYKCNMRISARNQAFAN